MPNEKAATPDLQALLSHSGRYLLIGMRHSPGIVDAGTIIDAMPALKSHNVTVFGLELSPELNPFFEKLQNSIRNGASQAAIEGAFTDERLKRGTPLAPESVESICAIIRSATGNGMRVVGLDRRDNAEDYEKLKGLYVKSRYLDQTHSAGSEIARDAKNEIGRYLFGKDGDAAREAESQMEKEPSSSRMALLPGFIHMDPGPYLDAYFTGDRPPTLIEHLRNDHQPVTAILPFNRAAAGLDMLPAPDIEIGPGATVVPATPGASPPAPR